jgi:hypothetical protein
MIGPRAVFSFFIPGRRAVIIKIPPPPPRQGTIELHFSHWDQLRVYWIEDPSGCLFYDQSR